MCTSLSSLPGPFPGHPSSNRLPELSWLGGACLGPRRSLLGFWLAHKLHSVNGGQENTGFAHSLSIQISCSSQLSLVPPSPCP